MRSLRIVPLAAFLALSLLACSDDAETVTGPGPLIHVVPAAESSAAR